MIDLVYPADPVECIKNVVPVDSLVNVTIDHSSDELVIIHHVTTIGKSLRKYRNVENVVSLTGMGSIAQIVRFQSINGMFHYKHCMHVTSVAVTSNQDLDAFESDTDFKI